MANDVQAPPEVHAPTEPNLTTLVSGIISDAQELFKQQIALLRSEVRSDLQKTARAVGALAVGAFVMAIAGLLLIFSLVYLLAWAVPDLPLGACYAIVGGLFAVIGAALMFAGVRKFQSFNPLPDQTVAALTENLQWRTNPNPR